jgi:hypothetical protein
MSGTVDSIKGRFASTGASETFFQPVQLHLQLADLTVELGHELGGIIARWPTPRIGEDTGQLLEELPLPLPLLSTRRRILPPALQPDLA